MSEHDEHELNNEDPDVIDTGWNSRQLAKAEPAPTAPLSLLAIAIQKGVDADQLDKLLAMQERYEKNQAEKAFNQAMHLCQEALPVIVKDKTGHQGKRWASLEEILMEIRPIYARHGFSISFTEEACEIANHIRVVCRIAHTDGCTRETAAAFPLDVGGNKTAIDVKASTFSRARRYLVTLAFNLTIADQEPESQASNRINSADVKVIDDLIAEVLDAGLPFDKARFLKWADAPNIPAIPQANCRKVVMELERKLREKK